MHVPTRLALLVASLYSAGALAQEAAADNEKVLPQVDVVDTADPGYKADKATLGKQSLSPREIPNSVSVLTRQQMDDQNLVTMADALQQVTGVNVIANDTLSNQYYALGVMYDGVTSYNGLNPSNQFDLPLYESIEVLRGPAGLLRGVGEPGGVVNLVKKKPKDAFAASWSVTTGSWNTLRTEGDITGPLNEDKTLRGRLVLADEDRGYFYDHTHGKKWLFMGALEYDLSPATTLSLSFSAQDQNVKAPWSGLPAYENLTDPNTGVYPLLNVSPSTFNVPDWGRMSYHTEETTASVVHRFDSGWTAKANVNHREQNLSYKYAYTSSGLNPLTGRLSYSSSRGNNDYIRDGIDLYAEGPFQLWGRTHNLVVGYNTEIYNSKVRSGSGPAYSNVLFGDLSALAAEPNIAYTSGSESNVDQSGLYSSLRLSITDPLTVVLGGRTTTFRSKNHSISPSTQTAWVTGKNRADNEFTPFGGILYDLTRQITLYGSYADIFIPQTQLKADGTALDPRVGHQYEIGSKGEFFDGKLGATLALFNLRDKNRAFPDPDPSHVGFYVAAGEIESKGWEAEITGKLLTNLDVTAGYTHLTTRYLKDAANQGLVYSIQTPNNQFKLWGDYRFDKRGPLAGFDLGLGIIANSAAQSSRGWRDQVLNSGYTVLNGRIGYQIDKTYALSLQINNLLDKRYYASVGTPNIYNFYGEPRSFMLTLRGHY